MFGLHNFKAGTIDATKCVHCKRTNDMHSCDVCGNPEVAVQLKYGNMLMCGVCTETEERLEKENNSPANISARVNTATAEVINAQEIILKSRAIDASIEIDSDVFNAETTPILELKKAIDENTEITNKPYALAEELKTRFEKFQSAIFEREKQNMEDRTKQRAIQSYMNQLANSLRAEEREKLKIQDMNYQPKPVKSHTVKPIKTSGTASPSTRKSTKADVEKFSKEYSIPAHMIAMLMVAKGIPAEDAARQIKKSIDAAKQS